MLLPATTTKAGEPYDDLEEVYGRMLGQWALEMNHVARDRRRLQLAAEAHRPGRRALHADPARAAGSAPCKFLNDNAFPTPAWVVQAGRPAPHRAGRRARSHRGEPAARAELAAEQRRASRGWSSRRRSTAPPPTRRSTSSPTSAAASGPRSTAPAAAQIDAYRRNLQRAYVETLGNRVNGAQAQSDDARAFFRGELKTLDGDLTAARRRARPTARRGCTSTTCARRSPARSIRPSRPPRARRERGTELSDESLFDVSSAIGHLLAGLCGGAEEQETVVGSGRGLGARGSRLGAQAKRERPA